MDKDNKEKFDNDLNAVVETVEKMVEGKATQKDLDEVLKSVDELQKSSENWVSKEDAENIARAQAMDAVTENVGKLLEKADDLKEPVIEWTKSGEGRDATWGADINIDDLYSKYAEFNQIEKAVSDVANVPGSGTRTGMVWTPKVGRDTFRPLIDIIDASGYGRFPVVAFSEVTMENRAEETEKSLHELMNQGTATAQTATVEDWEVAVVLSLPAIQDVPDFANKAEIAIMRSDAKRKGTDTYTVLQASVQGSGFTAVKTDDADDVPAEGVIIAKTAELMTSIGTDYMEDGVFVMSRAYWARLKVALAKAGSGALLNAGRSFEEYPVLLSDRMANGKTQHDVSCAFGNWYDGICRGESKQLSIESYRQTKPGNIVFYGWTRFKNVAKDTNALAGIISQA